MTVSNSACIAIVIEGGSVQSIVLQGYPKEFSPPHFVVVDYDTKDASSENLIRFAIDGKTVEAICGHRIPEVYEEFTSGKALSPNDIRSAIDREQFQQQTAMQVRGLIAAVQQVDRDLGRMYSRTHDYENLRRIVLNKAEDWLALLTDRSC